MKTHLLRLGSVIAHGVGGPEAGMIDLIYNFLLQEFEQDIYSRIGINQIGDDLNEFVMKSPNKEVHVNIRFPASEDFESISNREKNFIRLSVIHEALLRLAEFDKKLDKEKLEQIKQRIIENDFSFDFVCKTYKSKHENLHAKIIVHPETNMFQYFLLIEEDRKLKCKIHLYSGGTDVFYFPAFFNFGKWKGNNEFILTGTKKETEIHVFYNECRFELINLTPYSQPPYFEMMRADISQQEKDKAVKDWEHSLNPTNAAIIRQVFGNATN